MSLIFSIATPTLNSLDKLKRCVGSVRGQKNVEYEHIIHDAQSVDGTAEWGMEQKDLLFKSQSDNGMYDAINKAWDESTGDILCWLNSDEQYLPGTLKLVQNIFENNSDVDFVYGNAIVITNEGLPLSARREIRLSTTYISNSFLNAYSCTMFFRKKLFDGGLLRLDDRFKYASDMDMVLRLLDQGTNYIHINQYLSLFTFDGNNLSCSPKMLLETTEIQKKYGAFSIELFRKIVVMGRYFERLITGSYLKEPLKYDFALDEKPNYKLVEQDSVTASYHTR